MRTTLTIEDALQQRLLSQAQERGLSYKDVVNEALSKGLSASEPQPVRYQPPVFAMGAPLVDLTKAASLAGELEDQEILRKMAADDSAAAGTSGRSV
jgi:hypothetical protein